MRIDKILENNGLPAGSRLLAALSNKTVQTLKWRKWLATVPHGLARCRSLCCTHTNVVVMAEDAAAAGATVAGSDFCVID